MILASRLDRLEVQERAALECMSVAGLEVSAEGIQHLFGREADKELGSLTKKEFVEPARGGGCRFRHALIRDAAYRSISKARRAKLHERLALWMDETLGPRVSDYAAIIGYHFEQAFSLRRDLAPRDISLRELASSAAQRLAAAGKRAHSRDDMEAVKSLMSRAKQLYEAAGTKPLEVMTALGDALIDLRDMSGCEQLARGVGGDLSAPGGARRGAAGRKRPRRGVVERDNPGCNGDRAYSCLGSTCRGPRVVAMGRRGFEPAHGGSLVLQARRARGHVGPNESRAGLALRGPSRRRRSWPE